MVKKTLPLSQVYRWMETGPVVLVTTSVQGKDNVMTMSWHMMVDFEPPLIGCVIGNGNYTFTILKQTKECVINIPSKQLISQVVKVGNVSGRKTDKFQKFHLKRENASIVNAPLLSECLVHLECRVIDQKMARKYNIFILEVVKGWIRPQKEMSMIHHFGRGNFIVDGEKIHRASLKK
ncbi:MAG: flavin reductase family protein [Parachlamydiales bacterium]|nr:flavin reductase family protein [Parachlamydiales bacterium]